MKKQAQQTSKVFLLFIFLSIASIMSYSSHAQGPNAPEAASFEPVDATDMVNLITGDMSYVMPLLNIPSPEGGYPMALSYHAGIAMDQDASWVGLGWSLNPGAINRGVNGYPDDWGKTNVSEFFYDLGFEQEFYSFGTGVTFGGGVNVGLGLSWGSNKSLGGFVSASLGVGGNNGISALGASIGTEGVSAFGGLNMSGVGVGYGGNSNNSVLGISLNYSYNSGLSGGVSLKNTNGNFQSKNSKASGTGIGFGSSSNIYNNTSNGAGISFSNSSVSSNDYETEVNSSGFFLPVYMFYVNFGKTRVKNSLFKINNTYVSGILNPLLANKTNDYELNGTSASLLEHHFMDVNVLPEVENILDYDKIINYEERINMNNMVLPNYDNYTVTAQGLSGSITPYSIEELNLSSRGKDEQNSDNLYEQYLDYDINYYQSALTSGLPSNRDFLNKVHFTFENYYNSFLRIDKTNISNSNTSNIIDDKSVLEFYNTTNSGNYNQSTTVNRRKREGNFIETYSNREIRESYTNGATKSSIYNFIDAKEINNQNIEINVDRSNDKVFLDEGIGAYQITTPDGKTYHYSLPVYQFESFYKNFKDRSDENKNFFEIRKTTPYATHWLLTAITGPDYIDKNNNGKCDEADYGYWVEFDYGKWSDGYIWQTPNDRYEKINNGGSETTYSYAWGRKQVYYLDAIKTRTHTALFVKKMRDDGESISKKINSGQEWQGLGSFDLDTYAQKFETQRDLSFTPIYLVGTPGDILYDPQDNPVNLPALYQHNGQGFTYEADKYIASKVKQYNYVDIPQNKLLKLEKIILLKNIDLTYNFKNNGSNINERIGRISHNTFYDVVNLTNKNDPGTNYSRYQDNVYLRKYPSEIKYFNIHQHKNVLDVADIEGLDLLSKAQQVVEFDYDYSLAKETPNSSAVDKGKLTLDKVYFKGKKDRLSLPPYSFNYRLKGVNYNADEIDGWGYHKQYPDVWSLTEIKTPTGGKIKINYEPDDYHKEVVKNSRVFTDGLMFFITAASPSSDIFIEVMNDLDPNTEIIQDFTDYFKTNNQTILKLFICRREKYGNRRREVKLNLENTEAEVIELSSDKVKFRIAGDINLWSFDDQDEGWIANRNWSKFGVYHTNGNSDGVIIRNTTSDDCHPWRPSYNNSDVSINYKMFSNENPLDQLGGGIRVKDIIVSDNQSLNLKTSYYYNDPSFDKVVTDANYRSSGVTSYAPSSDVKAIPYISELPPPTVLYSNVTMENYSSNGNFMGGTKYKFKTLNTELSAPDYIYGLDDVFTVKKLQDTIFSNGKVIANKYEIQNRLSSLGQILSMSSYNSKNQTINLNNYNYKENLDGDLEIGVAQETHKSSKKVVEGANQNEVFYVSSTSKVNYPSVLESSSTTQGNFKKTIYYDEYDFLTGQLLETRTFNSKGNTYKTKTVPAYTIPEYSDNLIGFGMGSKVDDNSNMNMLIQKAANYTYFIDPVTGQEKVLNATITTWNNDWSYRDYAGVVSSPTNGNEKIWRKHRGFIWEGDLNTDGTYKNFTGTYDGFNWGIGQNIVQTNSEWKNTSTATRYDHYSTPLESKDVNDNYTSTKMGDGDSKVILVANAKYTEMYYCGAEYLHNSNAGYFDGEIKSIGRQPDLAAHTGKYTVSVGVNENAFELKVPADEDRSDQSKQKFKVSVWVRKGGELNARIKVGATTKFFTTSETVKADNWVLLNGYVNIPATETTVAIFTTTGTIDLDDFRLHPIASSMTSYVYNEWDELWCIIGSNGLATKFEYDAAGRLIRTYTEIENYEVDGTEKPGGFKQTGKNRYNYKAQ